MFDYLNIDQVGPLPTPFELLQTCPLTPSQKLFIENQRKQIKNILNGDDPRLLVIVGPCSIHDITAAKEYATKLLQLSRLIEENCFVVMRVYFEKPRTSRGWKGFLYDPALNETYDIASGLRLGRQLLSDLATLGIATAAEFLDPLSSYYFSDLISWGCIGARTSASQTHRQLASSLSMPMAFKNSTDGNIENAINGIISAALPHTFLGIDLHGRISTIRAQGNQDGHLVLRGSCNGSNYDPESISQALSLLSKADLPQRVLIDCAHDNSFRQHHEQLSVFKSVFNQVAEGNRNIRGILLESNLFAGNQPFSSEPSLLKYAVSLTDPCLDWSMTEHLLIWGNTRLKQFSSNNTLQTTATTTSNSYI